MFGLFGAKKRSVPYKILFVDDESDYISSIQHRLEVARFKIIKAANGREGLQKAVKERPDLILLDITMPVMDGHEMLENLRKEPALRNTPVIMCTVRSGIHDITKASSYNISDYITKPFDYTELTEKIINLVRK